MENMAAKRHRKVKGGRAAAEETAFASEGGWNILTRVGPVEKILTCICYLLTEIICMLT